MEGHFFIVLLKQYPEYQTLPKKEIFLGESGTQGIEAIDFCQMRQGILCTTFMRQGTGCGEICHPFATKPRYFPSRQVPPGVLPGISVVSRMCARQEK